MVAVNAVEKTSTLKVTNTVIQQAVHARAVKLATLYMDIVLDDVGLLTLKDFQLRSGLSIF